MIDSETLLIELKELIVELIESLENNTGEMVKSEAALFNKIYSRVSDLYKENNNPSEFKKNEKVSEMLTVASDGVQCMTEKDAKGMLDVMYRLKDIAYSSNVLDTIEIEKTIIDEIKMPDGYSKSANVPGAPLNSYTYINNTSKFMSNLLVFEANEEQYMPGDVNILLSITRNNLKDNEGIIKLESGATNNGNPYIYKLIKMGDNMLTRTYCFQLQMYIDNKTVNITGNIINLNGERASLLSELHKNGEINMEDISTYACDPYDNTYKVGALMNITEKEIYDEKYPEDALSEARNLIRFFIDNN